MYRILILLFLMYTSVCEAQNIRITSPSQHPLKHRASDIMLDTSLFDTNLGDTDINAQIALDTLDELVGGGGGDSISVDGVAVIDPNFASTGDVDFIDTANTITANVNANSVALTTDTTGDYVKDVADGTGIDGTATGEGSTYTPTIDTTEISGNRTWGDASTDTIAWTFNRATGTDPVITINSSDLGINSTITETKADPSIILNTTTATDTDFWLGVQEDAGADDDDTFQIGDGTTPGTNPFMTIDTAGNVGIGDQTP